MKIPKSILIKDTVSLFSNKYKYKVVLVCPLASWFRGNDLANVSAKLTELTDKGIVPSWAKVKLPDDVNFTKGIHDIVSSFDQGYDIRVEQPFINFYTNESPHVEKLCNLDPIRIKYISIPNKNNPELSPQSVIVKKLDFDYKIFMGRTRKNYRDFVTWAEGNKKVRLTPTVKSHLIKDRSWGGSYFYVKGEQTLTMVKLFLGSDIAKIDNVIKA